jgi:two-component system, NtrC family, sensor kinase
MNLFALSGLLTGLSSLAFGLFVYWKGAHSPLNRLWFMFTTSVAVWGFGGMWIALAPSPHEALWAWRLSFACGVVWIPILFHHFVHAFCNLRERTFLIAAYVTGIAVFPLCFTNLFFSDVKFLFSSFYYALPGPIFPVFTAWWVSLVVYSHYELYKMHGVTPGLKRRQIEYFFLATAIGYAGGSLDYLPIFGVHLYPYGNFAIVLYPMIMTYAIVQYRLMDIAVVVNKGLVYGLVLLLVLIPMYLAILFTQHFTVHVVPLLLASSLVFVCGAWVVGSNPAAITNRTFGLLCLGISIWLLSTSMVYSATDERTARFWEKCIYVGIIYIPALVYQFCVRLQGRTHHNLVAFNYLIGTVFLSMLGTPYLVDGHYAYFWGLYPKAGALHPLFLAYFFGVGGLALRELYLSSKSSGGVVPPKASRAIFWAFVVGLVASIDFIPSYGIPLYPIGYLMAVLLVTTVSYVFIKHEVLDISIILKPKVLIVAEALAVITSCYLAILFLTALFTSELHYLLAALLVATFSAFAGSFVYFQSRIEKEVKKTLFRESHDAYETLLAFSKTLVTILELKSLTGEIVRTLVEVLGASTASLYLRNEDNSAYTLSTSVGQNTQRTLCPRFRKDDPLIRHLLQVHAIVVQEELEIRNESGRMDPILTALKAMEAEACIPLINKGSLIGFCNLGSCTKLKMSSSDDIHLLTTLGQNAAIALDNALLYEDLKRSQKLVQRADRLRSLETIAGGFAHEIRNPLTSIRTFIELAPLRREDPYFMDQFSSVVKDDVSRIERLIHEILGYARYMEPKLGQENINEIVMGCILFLQVKAEQQGIHITHDLADTLPHMLLDRQQIKQVLLNLFLNAMDAITAPGGRISVRTYVLNKPNQGVWVHIEVADNGCGISPGDLEHIFDPFYTTKHKSEEHEGTGLGLVIVHQIIEQHSGHVEVESQEGRGTTFVISLPLNPETIKLQP